MAGISLTHQTDGRDILMGEGFGKSILKQRNYRKDIQTDRRTLHGMRGKTHTCERENQRALMARIDYWKTVTYRLSAIESISATTTTTDFLYLVLIYGCYLLSSSVESLQTRGFGGTHYGKRKRKKKKKKKKERKKRTGSSKKDRHTWVYISARRRPDGWLPRLQILPDPSEMD